MRTILLIAGLLFTSSVFAQSEILVPPVYLADRYRAPENAPSNISIADANEPGERIVVSGQIVDGTKPIVGASVFVFHTDINGKYSLDISGPDGELNPRLYGFLKSDAEGRYQFESIRPGSYDNNPAHFHYVVIAAGYKPRIFDLWLQDDPLLVARREAGEPQIAQSMRNSPFFKIAPDLIAIRPVTQNGNGIWHAVRNLDMIPE